MAKAFVSVLVDTYNHERFIEKAIVSVLEQDFPAADREILVVDDGSTDGTPEILKKFTPRIRILRKENGGQASAFNAGIPECKGEIVAFLDGDDWWAEKKLTRVAETLAARPSVGIVGHGIVIAGRDGHEQTENLREGHHFQANTVDGAKLFRVRCSFLGTSRMTIRTPLLRRMGPVPEAIRIQADEYLFTLAAVLAEVRILPEALTYYRLHEANRFQLAEKADSASVRSKQHSLGLLATHIDEKLREFGVEKPVRRAVVEYTEACATQLRLAIDGGWPWETTRTEWTLYRVLHPDAGLPHRILKLVILGAAAVTPPRLYYGMRGAVARNGLYQKVRESWFPAPGMDHIENERRVVS